MPGSSPLLPARACPGVVVLSRRRAPVPAIVVVVNFDFFCNFRCAHPGSRHGALSPSEALTGRRGATDPGQRPVRGLSSGLDTHQNTSPRLHPSSRVPAIDTGTRLDGCRRAPLRAARDLRSPASRPRYWSGDRQSPPARGPSRPGCPVQGYSWDQAPDPDETSGRCAVGSCSGRGVSLLPASSRWFAAASADGATRSTAAAWDRRADECLFRMSTARL